MLKITRHLDTSGHKLALEREKTLPTSSRLPTLPETSTPTQPSILTSITTASETAMTKMIRTAYELAINPTLPLMQYKTLVKVQRVNGVRLIEGRP